MDSRSGSDSEGSPGSSKKTKEKTKSRIARPVDDSSDEEGGRNEKDKKELEDVFGESGDEGRGKDDDSERPNEKDAERNDDSDSDNQDDQRWILSFLLYLIL